MTTEKRNDEIDLIELFLNIYIFFKKNFWFIIISAFIGAGLGYSTKYFATEHFESSMLIESYTLPDDIVIEYMNSIQNLINDNNYKSLSDKIGVDEDKLSDLREIKAEKVYDEKSKEDLEYIKVSAKMDNNSLYSYLSNYLQEYLKKETYVKREIEIFIEQNNSLINKIEEEIHLYEELQKKELKESYSKSNVNINNVTKTFQNDIVELMKEKQKLQKELKFAAPFRVIEDFIIYQKPIKKTVTYTLTGGLLFGFAAMLLLIFRNINRSIKEKELN